jgi:putative transposase
VGQPRSTQRYEARRREDEGRIVAEMLELVRHHPRYGYRRIWSLLRRGGWRVNRKRIWRLWKREGLKVPRKQGKKRRLGSSENGCVRRRAERPDHVWAWDFIHDRTTDGRPLKWLTIVDEFTRENLALEVARSIRAEDVVDVMLGLVVSRGAPTHIRSDNGPEFIAAALRKWLRRIDAGALYVEPGCPWENGYAEAFHSRLRDELLNAEEFATLAEAKVLAAEWREEYNERRPHSALGYRTPAEFATACVPPGSATLRPPEHTREEEGLTLITPGT